VAEVAVAAGELVTELVTAVAGVEELVTDPR